MFEQLQSLQPLKEINPFVLIAGVFTIVAIYNQFAEQWEKLTKKFGFTTKKQREYQARCTKLEDHDVAIAGLSNSIKAMDGKIDSLITQVKLISDRQETQEQRSKESAQARSKDRLYQSYIYYKNRSKANGGIKEWTTIESDGFWSLFSDYESNGGNGKVHETVEPYMREFVINDNKII